MKRYKSRFIEDFEKKDLSNALKLIINILGKRLETNIVLSQYPNAFTRNDGAYEGFRGIFGSKAIRFNFKLGDTSGKLASIDMWNGVTKNPDLTIDVSQVNIVKAIDIITQAIKDAKVQDFQVFEEKASPPAKEKISDKIAKSIQAWMKKMEVDDAGIQTSRILHLFHDYTFWFKEYGAEEDFYFASQSSFNSYLKKYMNDNDIENIFTKKIKVKKASAEKIKVNKGAEVIFDKAIYELSLDDLLEQAKMATVSVIKGYKNARTITGTSGVGKSKSVLDTLHDFGYSEAKDKFARGKAYKLVSGDIKNTRALYMLLYDFNSPDMIIVFDDANSIIKNKNNVELMRVACSEGKKRKIFYSDNKINDENKKYKTTINFKSKIIIITNIPKKKIDNAIVSRTSPIEIIAGTDEIIDSLRKALNDIPPPEEKEKKLEVLDFIAYEMKKDLKQLDFRLYSDALLWRLTDSPKWKKFVYAALS